MTKTVHLVWIGLVVLTHVVGSTGVARADAIEDKLEAADRHLRCRAYARAGADFRAAFDAAADLDIDVSVRSQLLIRAAAAFRLGELWADAAGSLEAYAALTPLPFDFRFRLAEAAQLRGFAAGRLDAHLEGDLDLDGLIDGDLDFDGLVDAVQGVSIPRPEFDPRFGLDLDADGDLDLFFGAPLGRIAGLFGNLAIGGRGDADARAGIDWRALGLRYRAAFDAGMSANLSIGARGQLLLRAAAAFRRGELWLEAAAQLDAYAALVPPALDVRLRIGEAAQLRAFAAGDLDADLEAGLGLGSLLGPTVSLDPRYGIDFDADGDLDPLVGIELTRIAAALGTDMDLPGMRAIGVDLPDIDLASPLGSVSGLDGDLDLDPPNPHLSLMKGLGIGIGSFVGVVGIVGLSVGLRARGIHPDIAVGDVPTPPQLAQLALEVKLRRWMKATLSIGGIAAAGVITAVVILAVRGNRSLDGDLGLDCEARWRLAPGPGLAGIGVERRW